MPSRNNPVYGYTWADPATQLVSGETGQEPMEKNSVYFRRNWSTGTPFSSLPAWADMDHLPPSQRELVARPDLAFTAMKRILHKVERDMKAETNMRMKQQARARANLSLPPKLGLRAPYVRFSSITSTHPIPC